MSDFRIREAVGYDVSAIHALGSRAEELEVGGVEGGFPSLDDLETAIDEDEWVVADNGNGGIVGFCCARRGDSDGRRSNSACLIYILVAARYRRRGLAKALLDYLTFKLGVMGVEHVYTWANPDSGAVEAFEKHGFSKGKTCVWMDCDLARDRGRRP